MPTLFQTRQQQAVASESNPPQTKPAICQPAAIVRRTAPPPRRALRTYACAAAAAEQRTVTLAQLPLLVPPPGKSVYHVRRYVDNVAATRQVLAQQNISLGVNRPFPPPAPDPDPYPPPGAYQPPLGYIGFSVWSVLVMIMAHLADKHDVNVFTRLEKLEKTTRPLIDRAMLLLKYYDMPRTLAALEQGTDPAPYLALRDRHEYDTEAFFKQLGLSADHLIDATICCRKEAPPGRAIDWPPPAATAAPATPPAPSTVPATAADIEVAAALASEAQKPRIGTKRAKKIVNPRRKS
jgi:hypothetical protein